MENVRAFEASDQAASLTYFIAPRSWPSLKTCVAFKLNLDDANPVAFIDHKRDRQRRR